VTKAETTDVRLVTHGHIEGLDGLRGAALLMVMIAHLYLLNLGWIGMQSFFVLSGFLITRVLLNDRMRAPSFGNYLKRFYIRRLWRILPLYYGYLLIMVVVTEAQEPQREHLFYGFTYLYNFFKLRADREHSFYFDHLWSMSVEEQFYLVWPFVLYWFREAVLKKLLIGLVFLGLLLRAATWLNWPFDIAPNAQPWRPLVLYLVTWSYLDAFAIGALVNFVTLRPRPIHVLAYVAAMFALGIAVNGIGVGPMFTDGPYLSLGWPLYLPRSGQAIWGYSVVNVLLFLLICLIISHDPTRRIFSHRVLDFLGKRSYPAYLLHYPLLAVSLPLMPVLAELTGHRITGTLLFAVLYLPPVLLLASIAHRFVEMPAIDYGRRFSPRPGAPVSVQPVP
jgi:peptidoglycan/LPS O-acetylase OafA/YrhL